MSSNIHRSIFAADKTYIQTRITDKTADTGNFDEFDDSSDNKVCLFVLGKDEKNM